MYQDENQCQIRQHDFNISNDKWRIQDCNVPFEAEEN